MPSTSALKEFKSGEGAAVLFGTDSFWEGVDVPGEALSLCGARQAAVRGAHRPGDPGEGREDKGPWRKPVQRLLRSSAVLKFKQGFDVIRTTEDHRCGGGAGQQDM